MQKEFAQRLETGQLKRLAQSLKGWPRQPDFLKTRYKTDLLGNSRTITIKRSGNRLEGSGLVKHGFDNRTFFDGQIFVFSHGGMLFNHKTSIKKRIQQNM